MGLRPGGDPKSEPLQVEFDPLQLDDHRLAVGAVGLRFATPQAPHDLTQRHDIGFDTGGWCKRSVEGFHDRTSFPEP